MFNIYKGWLYSHLQIIIMLKYQKSHTAERYGCDEHVLTCCWMIMHVCLISCFSCLWSPYTIWVFLSYTNLTVSKNTEEYACIKFCKKFWKIVISTYHLLQIVFEDVTLNWEESGYLSLVTRLQAGQPGLFIVEAGNFFSSSHPADHPPPSRAKIKDVWSYMSTPPYTFMMWYLIKHRDNFTLQWTEHKFLSGPILLKGDDCWKWWASWIPFSQ